MKKLLLNVGVGAFFICLFCTQTICGKQTGQAMDLSVVPATHSLAYDSIPWSSNKGRESLEQRKKGGVLKADTLGSGKDTASWNNQQTDGQRKSKSDWKHHKPKMSRDSTSNEGKRL